MPHGFRRAVARKKKSRLDLVEDHSITSELIYTLMTREVLGTLKMPHPDAIVKLAVILEGWRQDFIGSQIFDPLKNEAHVHAFQLQKVLRTLSAEFSKGADVFPRVRLKIEVIDSALQSIERLYGECVAVEGATRLRWMWLANALPSDFIEAVHSSNPGRAVGISQGGPLSRFIEAVVPHLTGEHPTAKSIAAQLKSHRSRTRTGNS